MMSGFEIGLQKEPGARVYVRSLSPPQPHSAPSLLPDCHCLLFLVVASLKGRLAHLTNRHGSAHEQITTFKALIKSAVHTLNRRTKINM